MSYNFLCTGTFYLQIYIAYQHLLSYMCMPLANNPVLSSFQERIARAHGSQCGFCTPGFVMSMYTLLRNNTTPSEEEVEAAFEGSLTVRFVTMGWL